MVKKSGPISALIHTTCTHFQKICSCLRHEHCKINIKIQISLVTLLRPCFRIISSKMLIFEVCLLLKTLLATTLIETREFTSRNYELNWTFQNHKKHKLLWFHSFVLLQNNNLKNANFLDLFTSKRIIGGYFRWNACTNFQKKCSCSRYFKCSCSWVAAFSETCAVTSWNDIVK